MKKKVGDTELQLDIIQDSIAAKIEELLNIEKEKRSAVEKMITMEQECKEMRDNEAVLNQHLEENQKKLRNEKVECAKLG